MAGIVDVGIAHGPEMQGVWVGAGQRSVRISGSTKDGTFGIYDDYRSGNSIITDARELHMENAMSTFSFLYEAFTGNLSSASAAEYISDIWNWIKEKLG